MLSERTKSLILGISSRNLVTLLILVSFFELQTVFPLPDDQFRAFPEERLTAFPDEQLSASLDSNLLVYPNEQLHAGSDCESLFCADPVDLLNNFGNGLRNLLPPPTRLVPLKPQPKPAISPGGTPDVPPMVDPQIEIFELAPNPDTQKCKPIAASNSPDSVDQQVSSWSNNCTRVAAHFCIGKRRSKWVR